MKHRMGSTASLGSLGLSGNTCVLTPGSLLLIPDPRGQELKGIMAQSWLDHGVSMWESQKVLPFVGLFQPHCHLLEICRNTSSRCTSLIPTSYRLRLLMGVSSSKTHWRLGGGWAENWQ